jgi:hypothetical protein
MHDAWPLLPWLLLGAALVIVVQSWRLGLQRAIAQTNQAAAVREQDRRAAFHARAVRGAAGEEEAFALLGRAGYEVIERQVPGSWTMFADGEALTFGLRADYLVARGDRRYIAEVKTGRVAPRLAHGPTRRQLLEYRAAFDVSGVILVDADGETLTEVDFAVPPAVRVGDGRVRPRVLAVVAAVSLLVGIVVGSVVR